MTKRQAEILTLMAKGNDGDSELVYERGRGFVGYEAVAARTVFTFLRNMWIRGADGGSVKVGGVERYVISEEGRAALAGVRKEEPDDAR